MGDGNDEQASRATLKKLQTAAVGFCWVAVFFLCCHLSVYAL